MDAVKQVNKRALKVYVRMHDGSRLVGAFYLAQGERLQDIMNDQRSFLPLYLDENKEHNPVTMVSKRYVQQVEEITDNRSTQQNRPSNEREPLTMNNPEPSPLPKKFELE